MNSKKIVSILSLGLIVGFSKNVNATEIDNTLLPLSATNNNIQKVQVASLTDSISQGETRSIDFVLATPLTKQQTKRTEISYPINTDKDVNKQSQIVKPEEIIKNVLQPSYITENELEELFSKKNYTAFKGLGSAFVQAEKETGVNAKFLVALAGNESGWGKSQIAKDKNNLFGFHAYNKSPYGSAEPFSTQGEGVMFIAHYIKDNYLTEGARYYNGVGVRDINTLYAQNNNGTPNLNWTNTISRILVREFS